MRFKAVVFLVAVAMATLAACGTNGSQPVSVGDSWGRTSPEAATNAAFYLTIEGGSEPDTLVSAASEVCGATEIHLSAVDDGVMSMQHLPDGIAIAVGETVTLEPGSFHVMCIDRQQDLVLGDEVPLTLEFADAGTVTVEVEIRDE